MEIPTEKIPSINDSEIYQWKMTLLFPLVFTNINFLSMNTKKITIKNQWMKKIYDISVS
jgi:hypothetical protein